MLRTLHPMIVHFPIALFFVTALVEVLYLVFRSAWLQRAGFFLLTLAVVAGVAAGVAGVISERYVIAHLTPADLALLEEHKKMAEASVFVYGLCWLYRLALRGRLQGLAQVPYVLGLLLGLGLIAYTGYLGGTMVYDHGVGIGVAPVPAAAAPAPRAVAVPARPQSADAPTAALAGQGEELYAASCADCHGPSLGRWVVEALGGPEPAASWIAAHMPPQAPGSLSLAESQAIVAWLLGR